MRRGSLRLPAVLFNGRLHYQGIFSPTFIQRDIEALIGSEEAGGNRARGGHSVEIEPNEYLRRLFAEAVRRDRGWGRLSSSFHRGRR